VHKSVFLAARLQKLGDEPRPAGLVLGPRASAIVAVKILIKE
jgi:hypothetical protein